MEYVYQGLAIAVIVTVYFVPTFVADYRRHPNRHAISMTNLLLGWTLLGWAVALIWSLTHFSKPAKVAKPLATPKPKPVPVSPPTTPPRVGIPTGGWD